MHVVIYFSHLVFVFLFMLCCFLTKKIVLLRLELQILATVDYIKNSFLLFITIFIYLEIIQLCFIYLFTLILFCYSILKRHYFQWRHFKIKQFIFGIIIPNGETVILKVIILSESKRPMPINRLMSHQLITGTWQQLTVIIAQLLSVEFLIPWPQKHPLHQ